MQKFTLGMLGAAVALSMSLAAQTASAETVLRLSHQWSTSDVRNKVAEIVAEHVAQADVDLRIQIYPTQSLFKAREQWQPTSRGQLDMAVFPLAYAGGVHPEFNLTLMPGLVKNHDHAARLNASPFMERIKQIAEDDGVLILVDGYLAGGFAGREKCVTGPEDVQGLQMRAAGKAFEQMLQAAGASIASMPSSEIYSGLQTGVIDGANTSAASLVSYRIYEQVICLTAPGENALWVMYEPILMSTKSFAKLNPEQQAELLKASAKAEEYAYNASIEANQKLVDAYQKAGVKVVEMTAEQAAKWRKIADESSYKAFADNVEGGKELLDMALSVD